MHTGYRLFPVLSLLSSLLTFAASGDDFCLPRLILPLTSAAPGALPLDDPNTDFITPTDPAAARQAPGVTCRDNGLVGADLVIREAIPPGQLGLLATPLLNHRHFPLTDLNPPLRC
jgi:hypothetical protein